MNIELRTIGMIWPNVEHFVLMNDKVEVGDISDIEGFFFSWSTSKWN